MLRLVGWYVDTRVRVKQAVRQLQVKAFPSPETSATIEKWIKLHVESSAVPLWEPQNPHLNITICFVCVVDRVGVVGIATHYGFDGPEIESQRGGGGRIFLIRPDRPWDPPSLIYSGYRVSFPGIKWLGLGIDHPLPPSSTEVRERVVLYLCSRSDPSLSVVAWTLPYICLEMGLYCHISSEWAWEFWGAFEKLRKAAITLVMSVCLSVLLHGSTRLPLGEFSLNFVFDYFSKNLLRKFDFY